MVVSSVPSLARPPDTSGSVGKKVFLCCRKGGLVLVFRVCLCVCVAVFLPVFLRCWLMKGRVLPHPEAFTASLSPELKTWNDET